MPNATLLSAGLSGIEAVPIHVEVDIARGMLPRWSTVGMAESAVKESKDRVISAIQNSGYDFPFRRITINLAPADLKKSGTAFDLPMAIGLLAAAELIPRDRLCDCLIMGELSLMGGVRPVRGALSVALLARKLGIPKVIVPLDNVWEAQSISDIEVLGAPDLPAVAEYLIGGTALPGPEEIPTPQVLELKLQRDLREIRGQDHAKRALEIAASGFHNILLQGPPGTGKSMLASRLPSILPPLSYEESLSTSQIYSMMGMIPKGEGLLTRRPFRSPHHSISDAGLIGGGRQPRPGEVSLAHNGVLFLDELTEFRKNVLESMRQPLEAHRVTISRASGGYCYPARFLLAAAMNPCPCGNRGHPKQVCRCDEVMIKRYQGKVSGPLLDRIDLHVEMAPLPYGELREPPRGDSSEQVRTRVARARAIQAERFQGSPLHSNSQMGSEEIQSYCQLKGKAEKILENAVKKWGWSARAYHRILRVARTVADLAACNEIGIEHLSEAISYRTLLLGPQS